MERLSYWNRPVVLCLFGAEVVLSAILIILFGLTTAYSFNDFQSWVIFYGLPLSILVFISSITHLIVIVRSDAILGAVVLVNFVWTMNFIGVTIIFGLSAFWPLLEARDGWMVASFAMSMISL